MSKSILQWNKRKITNATSNAFTMQELIVVIVIFLIVTALMLSGTIFDYKKPNMVIRLKGAYSTLSNLIDLSSVDNDDPSQWYYPQGNSSEEVKNFLHTYLFPYLKIKKEGEKCVENYYLKWLNKDMILGQALYSYQFVMTNNMIVSVNVENPEQGIVFYVDVNGDKPPNRVGRDVFLIMLDKTNMNNSTPFYGAGALRENVISAMNKENCNKKMYGKNCGWLIQIDAWKMKSDYPW